VTLRTAGGVLEIVVDNPPSSGGDGVEIHIDGDRIEGNRVELPSNGATRRVAVRLGSPVDVSSEAAKP